ncbi:MAG: hypothetical protein ACKO9Q_03010, partial [Pirellula sp.]
LGYHLSPRWGFVLDGHVFNGEPSFTGIRETNCHLRLSERGLEPCRIYAWANIQTIDFILQTLI